MKSDSSLVSSLGIAKSSALIILASLGTATFAQAQTLLTENFAEGQRLTQNLPNTAAWYNSATGSPFSYSEGALTMTPGPTAGRSSLAHFASSGNPIALEVGQALTVGFTFQVDMIDDTSSQTPDTFRVGMFNSNGNQITEDGTGNSNPLFNSYTGYSAMMRTVTGEPIANSDRPIFLRKRNAGVDNQLISSSQNAYSNLAGGVGGEANNAFASDITYTGLMTISRIGESTIVFSMEITGGDLSGYSHSTTDSNASTFAFDTVTFYTTAAVMDSLTLNSVEIGVIPEPSQVGLALGAFALLAIGFFRRRS